MTALRLRVQPPDYAIVCGLCGQYVSCRASVTLYDEEHAAFHEAHPACLKDYRRDQTRQWRSDRINAWRL